MILTGGGLHLCPAELFGGAALMAISASNVTFLYFSERFVSTALSAEEGNGLQFVDAVSVVEIQYQRVAFAAVDAGMGAQVFIYLPVEILSIAPLTFPVGRGVPGFVPSVVRLRVFAHARPTASSAQSPTSVAIGKVLGGFAFPQPVHWRSPNFSRNSARMMGVGLASAFNARPDRRHPRL